ncbi:hypothetical protein D3C87_2183510 [compost metagenome]
MEFFALAPLIHEQCFLDGAFCNQQGAVMLGVVQLFIDPLGAGFDVVHERPTLM